MEHPFFPTTTTRAEALRWLTIAEKLLSARDLIGSKSFASRARDSDPSLSQADQILAIADTLLAGDRRIGNNHHDLYAILRISPPQVHDADLIAGQYQSLSLLLSPSKNKFPFAEQAYRLVVDAWAVLSNPSEKPLYDNEIALYLQKPDQISNPIPATNQNFMFFGGNNSGGGGVTQPPAPPPRAPATVHFSQTQESNPNFAGNVGSFPEETQEQVNYNNSSNQQQNQVGDKTTNDVNMSENAGEKTDNHLYEDGQASENDDASTMWTACPYCYYMYKYPIVYTDCVLRCQNCKKAFQAVAVSSPPQVVDGENGYFCCWGLLPLGFSTEAWEKNQRLSSTWTPFSPMFTCPQGFNVNNNATTTKRTPHKSSVPRVYIDEDEVFVDISDSSEPDDDDWQKGSKKMKKKARSVKGKDIGSGTSASGKKVKNVSLVGDETTTQAAVEEPPPGESSKKGVVNGRKQPGRVVKNFGKLDLNVEFSNEPEESAPKVRRENGQGRREDEPNIEGIGFFEGLDEFLSSLPILNAVGDDKGVKAA